MQWPLRSPGEEVSAVNSRSNSHVNNAFTLSTEKLHFLNLNQKATQLAWTFALFSSSYVEQEATDGATQTHVTVTWQAWERGQVKQNGGPDITKPLSTSPRQAWTTLRMLMLGGYFDTCTQKQNLLIKVFNSDMAFFTLEVFIILTVTSSCCWIGFWSMESSVNINSLK